MNNTRTTNVLLTIVATLLMVLIPLLFISFVGNKNNSTNNDCIKVKQSIYLKSDIMHVDYNNLTVYYETNGGDPLEFTNIILLNEYVEEITAQEANISSYKDDLDYNIRNGYIYANTVYNADEQYTELIYEGPNWVNDPGNDTTYLLSTFNNVEKLYVPSNCTYEYQHYTVD